jgi:hypothetical protein
VNGTDLLIIVLLVVICGCLFVLVNWQRPARSDDGDEQAGTDRLETVRTAEGGLAIEVPAGSRCSSWRR